MLAQVIQFIAAGETSRAAQRIRRAMTSYLIAGICLAIGIGFLIAAGYIFVAERYGPLWTAVGFGAGFILMAGVALIVHRIVSTVQARKRAEEARAAQMTALAGALTVAVLPSLLKGRGGLLQIIVPALAMAGYAIYKENSDRSDTDGQD
jgi:formate/nitrite transporter FocA (FNT family)